MLEMACGIGGADLDLVLTYDKAGNLRTEERPGIIAGVVTWTYTHDAWNRLVLVESGATDDDRLINVYNGLNWRIIKRGDTPSTPNGLDQQRMMYYSAGWQLCEERIDDESALADYATGDTWSVTWSTNTPNGFAEHRYVTFSGDA